MGEIRIKRDVADAIVYGFHVDPSIQDPSNAVTYLEDAVGMTPASMGSTSFNSGSWADAFFIPKPCMVKYDGTVDYYLDPNDYKKKLDGTESDVDNINYDGNAMMEWPLIWYKYDTDGCVEGEVNFYVSNKQVDESYHCWCNYDADGNIIPHFYTAIYNGTSAPTYSNTATYSVGDRVTYSSAEYECITEISVGEAWDSSKWTLISNTTRLRSLSGVQLIPNNGNGNTSGTVEVNRATANNTTTKTEWYIDILADRELINMLLVLIGKSLNAQAVFGRGLDSGNQAAKEAYVTGTLDDKGLFWGVTTNGNNAVKVFGMENYWACVWHRVAGMVSVHDNTTNSNTVKIKLTHSTVDGTTVDGFNSTGNGYIDTGVEVATNIGVYIRKMKYFDKGYSPLLTTGGSATTYYSDYAYVNYVGTYYLLAGGNFGTGLNAGPFYFHLGVGFSHSNWVIAADLSLKPRAKTPYNPDWDNRPAHQFVNGEWIDIPTHHFINGEWQGELTSQSPLKFRADGEMLDWRIEGKTSGNLVESVTVSSDQALYGISLFLEAELKPDTLYTFAFQLAEGYFVYWNEFLFTNETPLVTGTGDTVLVVTKRTRSDLSKDNANQYRSSKGWVIHKNMKTQSSPASYNNVQILEGSYTSDTLPPYEPYGGVGDWDEEAQKYVVPVTVNGTTTNLYTDAQLMDGDSLDFATDQTSIPITQGDNTLTVGTAVQPKSVFVKFEG